MDSTRPSVRGSRTLVVAASILSLIALGCAIYAWTVSKELKEAKEALAARDGTIKLLEAEVTAIQSRLQDAQTRLAAQLGKKPDVPLRLALRSSAMGKGKVVVFKNMTTRSLSVAATFRNPALNMEKAFRLDFAPDEEKPFGHLEGWQFESGDEITLVNQQFETKKIKVP
jgi:hypothetical protein